MDTGDIKKRYAELGKSLNKLKERRRESDARIDSVLSDMRELANESLRFADMARSDSQIIESLDTESKKPLRKPKEGKRKSHARVDYVSPDMRETANESLRDTDAARLPRHKSLWAWIQHWIQHWKAFRKLQERRREAEARIDSVLSDMRETANESVRVADVARNAKQTLEDLDAEFEKRTDLDKIDVTFLFFATALQCIRQYILANDKFRLTASEGDKLVANVVPKSLHDILLNSVPFDATTRADGFTTSTELSGYTHRYRTLGHDPIMGWVFGPMNILSDSLTKYNILESYSVQNMVIVGQIPTTQVFSKGYEQIKADKYNLPAAVLRQAIHFGSDYFTKQGLPLPFISTIDNDFSKTLLTRFNVDMWSVTRGAGVAVLVNSLVSYIHQLFYNESIHCTHKLYEVKTRKILSYSNLIASASNVIYVAASSYFGDVSAVRKLDVGGILVTFWRLINDPKFINQVKREFIMESFNEMIHGKEYSLD